MPGENSVLVAVPGHVPQCVEIFNGKKVDMKINIALTYHTGQPVYRNQPREPFIIELVRL